MKQPVTRLIIFFFLLFIVDRANASYEKITGWKAGVASVIITPDEPLWMAGFAFRNHPSEGKLVDVWAKALALEDENGKRAVLVSIELSGLRKFMSDSIRNRLQLKYNLSRDQVLLSSTHTHSGPETGSAYLKDEIEKKKVDRYAIKLEDMIVELVGRALESLQPATLSAENGVSRFQVNRRNNTESKLLIQSQFIGPNDYAVPVISVMDSSCKIMAIVFGYACHNSILGDYNWSGDYAGFAQLELQKLYPGATALFFQGTGGDQIAYPRHTSETAKQHGRELAAAVERVLSEKMRELPSTLFTSYSDLQLEFAKPSPTKAELLQMRDDSAHLPDYIRRNAELYLEKIKKGEPFITSYPYPVQVWKIGDQPIITLGGEPVVGYALELKRIFGQQIFVFGYANDVMAYIPTTLVLNEGGYEGSRSPLFTSPWAANIETMIIQEVLKLAKQVEVKCLDQWPDEK